MECLIWFQLQQSSQITHLDTDQMQLVWNKTIGETNGCSPKVCCYNIESQHTFVKKEIKQKSSLIFTKYSLFKAFVNFTEELTL